MRHKKEIDYLLMNDQGLEGSVKTAMAEIEDDEASKHAEDGSQTKTGSDGEADDAAVGLSAHQGTSDNGDSDDDILCAQQEIDAKMKTAGREKKRLSDQIRLQKKMPLLEQLEHENRRHKCYRGVRCWTHQGIGRERVARTEGWWAAAQLGIAPEECKKWTQPEDNQGQGQSRIPGCSAQKNSDNRLSQG